MRNHRRPASRYSFCSVTEKKSKAAFVEPTLLLRTERPPEGPDWIVELKLDGYCAQAIKSARKVSLRSRNDNEFNSRYPAIVKAVASMPDETVIDGRSLPSIYGKHSFMCSSRHRTAAPLAELASTLSESFFATRRPFWSDFTLT